MFRRNGEEETFLHLSSISARTIRANGRNARAGRHKIPDLSHDRYFSSCDTDKESFVTPSLEKTSWLSVIYRFMKIPTTYKCHRHSRSTGNPPAARNHNSDDRKSIHESTQRRNAWFCRSRVNRYIPGAFSTERPWKIAVEILFPKFFHRPREASSVRLEWNYGSIGDT